MESLRELAWRANRLVHQTKKGILGASKVKILKYELPNLIPLGQEEIQVPYFSRPLDCLWSKPSEHGFQPGSEGYPIVYYGNEGGGELRSVTIRVISEKEDRDAPVTVFPGESYLGCVSSPSQELFFLFASLPAFK